MLKKTMHRGKRNGFTLLEIMIVVGVFVLVLTLSFASLRSFRVSQAMGAATETVFTAMGSARASTLASVGDTNYGVHLAEHALIVFQGTSYSASDPSNRPFPISDVLEIDNILLDGPGGNVDVIFNRITGTTDQDGTFVIQTAGGGESQQFEITSTGIVKEI